MCFSARNRRLEKSAHLDSFASKERRYFLGEARGCESAEHIGDGAIENCIGF